MLDNATIQQALESISGVTGLSFDITEKGVHVSFPPQIQPQHQRQNRHQNEPPSR